MKIGRFGQLFRFSEYDFDKNCKIKVHKLLPYFISSTKKLNYALMDIN